MRKDRQAKGQLSGREICARVWHTPQPPKAAGRHQGRHCRGCGLGWPLPAFEPVGATIHTAGDDTRQVDFSRQDPAAKRLATCPVCLYRTRYNAARKAAQAAGQPAPVWGEWQPSPDTGARYGLDIYRGIVLALPVDAKTTPVATQPELAPAPAPAPARGQWAPEWADARMMSARRGSACWFCNERPILPRQPMAHVTFKDQDGRPTKQTADAHFGCWAAARDRANGLQAAPLGMGSFIALAHAEAPEAPTPEAPSLANPANLQAALAPAVHRPIDQHIVDVLAGADNVALASMLVRAGVNRDRMAKVAQWVTIFIVNGESA